MQITKQHALKGNVTVPGDKSISHRSIMFGAIAQGLTEVTGFLQGADCLSTISCFRRLGIEIRNEKTDLRTGTPRTFRPFLSTGRRKQRHNHPADQRNPCRTGFSQLYYRRRFHSKTSHGKNLSPSFRNGRFLCQQI